MNISDKYKSPDYWTQMIQISLYNHIKQYLSTNHITQNEFAMQLGVSKGYVSQILNGDFDHKLSKLVELAVACGFVPKVEFLPVSDAKSVVESYSRLDQNVTTEHTKKKMVVGGGGLTAAQRMRAKRKFGA